MEQPSLWPSTCPFTRDLQIKAENSPLPNAFSYQIITIHHRAYTISDMFIIYYAWMYTMCAILMIRVTCLITSPRISPFSSLSTVCILLRPLLVAVPWLCFYHHVCNIAEGEVLDNLSPQPSTTACFSTSLFMNFASYDARLYYHGITRMFFDVILVATDFKLLYCVYFNLYYKCISSSL